jgi:hypothetical protein
MGTLVDFQKFLDDRHQVLTDAESQLSSLLQKYETYFAEITRVRESELGQLREAILADRSNLPSGLDKKLSQALGDERSAFDASLDKLHERLTELLEQAEAVRIESAEGESKLHKDNLELDAAEELLKRRNADLLERIERYNNRIREMGGGFGFLRNLFRMRKLAAERTVLDQQQADLVARIDHMRKRWQEIDVGFAEKEPGLKAKWIELTAEATALQAKIEHLQTTAVQIVQRSAFEKVLFARKPELAEAADSDPACPRCSVPNPASNHFCHICAERLVGDRPDLAGSLLEIAEVNLHHDRFSEGMQACQEILGLVRGLKTGLTAFTESVRDMINSQNTHSLGTLQIDVPEPSLVYGGQFDALLALVSEQGMSLHPTVFAGRMDSFIGQALNEEEIKGFFETMGEELTKQADAQW